MIKSVSRTPEKGDNVVWVYNFHYEEEIRVMNLSANYVEEKVSDLTFPNEIVGAWNKKGTKKVYAR